ncbi:MAG: hypothetical protein KatS3mg002_0267 [Candidatus Woesearchaeota archaeon]|nr:MAG: hypothetical protein KatS3mg002_0267 [Candidatus Woesearchaeota archaeon]
MQSSKHDEIDKYRKELEEMIFIVMETSRQSYIEVIQMPVSRFKNYLHWKIKFEEEKRKKIEEEMEKSQRHGFSTR